jgi:PAS domain S-box-containing protein
MTNGTPRHPNADHALLSMLEQASNSMLIMDAEFRVRACNSLCKEHCAALYGLTPEPGFDVLRLSSDPDALRATLTAVLAGEPTSFETEVPYPDGAVRWYSVRMTPVRLGSGQGPYDSVFWDTHDITDLKRAELDARALIENNIGAYAVLDRDLRAIAFNRVAAQEVTRITGRTAYRGMHVSEGLRDETAAVMVPMLEAVLEGNHVELPVRLDLDGDERHYVFVASPFVPEEGGPIAGVCLSRRETTQEVLARRRLAASERTLRAIFEGSTSSVFVIGRDRHLVFLNRRAQESFAALIGRTPQVGDPLDDYVRPEHEPSIDDAIARCFDGEVLSFEISLDHDGALLVLECTFTPFVPDPGGEIEGACVSISDVTERTQARARLAAQAALLDEATDAICVTSLDGRVLFWNRSAANLYGYPPEAAMGRSVWEITGSTRRSFELLRARLVANGSAKLERTLAARGGREIIVETSCTHVVREQQDPIAFFIDTDVTHARATERQLMRAQRLESLGALAGGIAHDLGNVLTPVEIAAYMLRQDLDDPELLDHLDVVQSGIRRASDLVSRVLTFARGSDGERVDLDPTPLLEQLVDTATRSFPRLVSVHLDAAPDLRHVHVERALIDQTLLNLLVNARDAVDGRGVIRVRAENVSVDEDEAADLGVDPGAFVRVTVQDDGAGIDPTHLEQIFDPFFTTKAPGEGTGLGLATALSIIKSHGGAIQAFSPAGLGARFVVSLPASTEHATPTHASHDAGSPSDTTGGGELILVVDDEHQVQQLLERMLERFGYDVVCASDGSEALAILEHRGGAALAIVDMLMPIMDGPSTIRALRRVDPDLPIIAVSGYLDEPRRQQLSELSVSALVEKPFASQRLLRTVRMAIEGTA